MKRFLLVLALFGLAIMPAHAQKSDPEQMIRPIVHPTIQLDDHWFVASWLIGNARHQGPAGNFNAFAGLGYRFGQDWVEVMGWRQWASANHWLIDVRSSVQFNSRTSMYNEFSPYLDQKAMYMMSTVDVSMVGRLSVGAETENTFKSPTSSLGAGPRVSWLLANFNKTKVVSTVAYQFRRDEPNVLRLYLIWHQKL